MPHRYAYDSRPGPNWRSRSVVTLAIGRWKMRNGQFVKVKKLLQLPYIESATKKPKTHDVWLGKCECCNSVMTWNANGTYAASGRHAFDIIKAA
jgi:hypothetical protein